MRPSRWWAACLLSALVTLALVSCAGQREDRPDVVLVVLDTLRPDFLGFYGYERETAPFLASLAERSAVLRRAYATSSWTAPSTASLFTSWSPLRHGVIEGFFAHRERAQRVAREGTATLALNRLPAGHRTLPELFREAGYRTFGLAANINIGTELGFARGFVRFERRHQASAEELGGVLDGWLAEDDGSRPRLIYLHLNDVHVPYTPREPWYEPAGEAGRTENEERVALYQGEIGYVDEALRRMFERHGWADGGAVVAVVSDHGQEFDDHGRHGHGFRLYRELVQVMALLHAPAHGVVAQEVHGNVSLLDVLPTLAELAGLPALPEWEGRSLVSVLRGEVDPAAHGRHFFSHRAAKKSGRPQEMWSVVYGDWHLIQRKRGAELFDLAEDPTEQNNLARERPEVVGDLAAELAAFRASKHEALGDVTVEVEIDRERLRELEALGYVQ